MGKRFHNYRSDLLYKSELLVKDTPGPTCCLRITDNDSQAYFVIEPDKVEEIIAAIREQIGVEDGKEEKKIR